MWCWVRAIAFLCLSAAAVAQSPPAVTLSGVVMDPSGAAIPHARIALHNTANDGASGDRRRNGNG